MAIGFRRKTGERFVIVSPTGEETWVLVRDGKSHLAFDPAPGFLILREEVYHQRKANGPKRAEVASIRPA